MQQIPAKHSILTEKLGSVPIVYRQNSKDSLNCYHFHKLERYLGGGRERRLNCTSYQIPISNQFFFQLEISTNNSARNYLFFGINIESTRRIEKHVKEKLSKFRGTVSRVFCILFFPQHSSSWSHQRCPRAVLIFYASWPSYKHFKMTPQCLGHLGVAPKTL